MALYDQLVRIDPSPIIVLNRAVAVAELDGPQVALAVVDGLEDEPRLDDDLQVGLAIQDEPTADFDEVMAVNVRGVFFGPDPPMRIGSVPTGKAIMKSAAAAQSATRRWPRRSRRRRSAASTPA